MHIPTHTLCTDILTHTLGIISTRLHVHVHTYTHSTGMYAHTYTHMICTRTYMYSL